MMHDATAQPTLSRQRLEAIGRRLEQDVAADKIAGATIAVGRQGGVAYQRSVGFRDVPCATRCSLTRCGASSP